MEPANLATRRFIQEKRWKNYLSKTARNLRQTFSAALEPIPALQKLFTNYLQLTTID
jgi:hypothetical protein